VLYLIDEGPEILLKYILHKWHAATRVRLLEAEMYLGGFFCRG
jgi:hypothetical protein